MWCSAASGITVAGAHHGSGRASGRAGEAAAGVNRRPFRRTNGAKRHRPRRDGLPRRARIRGRPGGGALRRLPAAFAATTLRELVNRQASGDSAVTLITTRLEDPTGYGRILLGKTARSRPSWSKKRRRRSSSPSNSSTPASIASAPNLLWKHIGEIRPDNPAHEYYLTDMVEILNRAGHTWPPSRSPMPANCWASTRAWSWPRWTRFSAIARCRN